MRVAWVVAVALVAGCYQPSVQAGLPCSSLGACPTGQVCDRGTCVMGAGEVDASSANDAATDAGTDGAVDAASLIDAPPGVLAWTEMTSLPSPRSLACLAAFGNRLYAIGGSFEGTSKIEVLSAPILAAGTLGAWSVAPDLPMATRWHGCAVDTTSPSIYVVGGDNGTTARAAVYRATIDTTSGALGAWVAQTSLPAGRRGLGVVWASGRLYAIGGEEADGFMIRDTVYHAATGPSGLQAGGWATQAGLFPADYSFGTALASGRIYMTGGFTGDATVRHSAISATGPLSSFATTTALPGPRERHVSVAGGGYLYVLGGEINFGGANLATVARASIAGTGAVGSWSALPPMPLALAYGSGVFAGGRIYIAGGSDGTTQTGRVFMLDGL